MRSIFFLVLLFTVLSRPGFSQSVESRNSLTVPIEFEGEELSFDVIQADEFIIQIALERPEDKTQRLPLISIEEYVGFECSVNALTLVDRDFDLTDRTYAELYEARISWRAGGDVSGCYLTFSDPYSDRSSKVHLYMRFE